MTPSLPISPLRPAPSSGHSQPFPDDWPAPGPINLQVHDLPHASSTIEWWYVNSHLSLSDGRQCSLFASFFRLAIGRDAVTRQFQYAHSLTWALSDISRQRYYADSLVDRCAPEVGLNILDKGEDTTDPLLQRALRDVFQKGNVPLPDRLLVNEAVIGTDNLFLDYDGNQFAKQPDGSYRLTLQQPNQAVSVALTFQPKHPPVRHGDDGVVRGTAGEDMFYYFMPDCRVEGQVTIDGQSATVTQATGWYDHEFGKPTDDAPEGTVISTIAWNWLSVQLTNGYRVSAYDLFEANAGSAGRGRWVIVIDPEGNPQPYDDFTLQPLRNWTSSRTFTQYPTAWQLNIPAAGIELYAEAAFPAQEFITIISKPAFWEGRVEINGRMNDKPVYGLGYVERSGFGMPDQLTDFFKAVTKETRKSLNALLPITPSEDQLRQLVASDGHEHYLDGIDRAQYSRVLLQPIREMIDRGGKSWRSYLTLACVDLVGGNSQDYLSWLAWPELLHTGSLIVDDVQDQSAIRRGGASCHELYGEPLAINAGNACYFLGELLLANANLTDAKRIKLYSLYFETMRAAHAGQAIDIDGFGALMPDVVAYGQGALLEERILAVHRLKSAVPASSLAQVGAVLGDGTPEQANALGYFVESLGLAFQIIDDVLNLRGFENDLKSRGEDITCGKITLPVAKAMERLDGPARRELWESIQAKPTDPVIVTAIIDQLETCGAIEACKQQAEALLETAWQTIEDVFPDSDVKIKLRAFSWYVLERHY